MIARLLASLRCLLGGPKPPPPASWTAERRPAPGAASEPRVSLPIVPHADPGYWVIRPMFMPGLMARANEDRGSA